MAQFIQFGVYSVPNHTAFIQQHRRVVLYFPCNTLACFYTKIQLIPYPFQAFIISLHTSFLDGLYCL